MAHAGRIVRGVRRRDALVHAMGRSRRLRRSRRSTARYTSNGGVQRRRCRALRASPAGSWRRRSDIREVTCTKCWRTPRAPTSCWRRRRPASAGRDGGGSGNSSRRLATRTTCARAVSGDTVIVSASTGPGGRRPRSIGCASTAARRSERCRDGCRPGSGDNVDTGAWQRPAGRRPSAPRTPRVPVGRRRRALGSPSRVAPSPASL